MQGLSSISRLYNPHWQLFHMQSQKMTFMRASSYRRVSLVSSTNMLNVTVGLRISSPRRNGNWKCMVSYIPCTLLVTSTLFRAILHDPVTYPEPDTFKPERFLNPDGALRDDPVLISTFGFGKRICPGRHFADSTLFISVASLFSVFNIERGRDGGSKLSDYTSTGNLSR